MTAPTSARSAESGGSGEDASPSADGACCTPLTREPLSAEAAVQLAGLLKAIADPTRLRLLSLIYAHEGGEACVCELTEPLELTQPTISHHLKVLVDAGLLIREKRGVWAYYQAVPAKLTALGNLITPMGIGGATLSIQQRMAAIP
ncbi:metalloregulator ArsR/SmtB family transcription factor [Frankia sp. Cppng1_Ct_nod]|uniref:ArsR/SmtB family transcription factor n=1 Tax=Frankia sp. Cppng1_Ct_nod TaxID=2897162 RepID=UPI0010410B9A|nr:metalloregulator ArsR/SmtB family transcription factor [Frankia sp. Cppng1_Ct_nod]